MGLGTEAPQRGPGAPMGVWGKAPGSWMHILSLNAQRSFNGEGGGGHAPMPLPLATPLDMDKNGKDQLA